MAIGCTNSLMASTHIESSQGNTNRLGFHKPKSNKTKLTQDGETTFLLDGCEDLVFISLLPQRLSRLSGGIWTNRSFKLWDNGGQWKWSA